ncbi:MAG: acetyltransferase [Bacteroidia bacterium]|nr:acetyltransferase [Bacteroidia bacterium]MDW8235964.1 acetyltransferase [Bacteroidia bacterium]
MILYGGGDHGYSLYEILTLLGEPLEGFFDDREEGFLLPKEKYLGSYDPAILPESPVLIAITDNTIRRNLSLRVRHRIGAPLIHPRAYVAPSAILEPGVVVMAGAVIHSQAYIGAHTIINTGAVVEHFVRVGAFTHISPGVVLACRSQVGDSCFIGTGALIVPHVKVGEGAIVGAGSLVLRDVPAFARVWGHPAQPQSPKI